MYKFPAAKHVSFRKYSSLNFRVFTVRDIKIGMLSGWKKVSPLDFSSIIISSIRGHVYASSRKIELPMFLLISSGHISAPKRYTDMASPYNALQRCVKRFGKQLGNCGPQRPETWTNCLYISLLNLHK